LDPADYKEWAYGLKKAGYATNPKYPALLIKYIETYNLNDYSLIALGKKKESESIVQTKVNPPVKEEVVQETQKVTEPVVAKKEPTKKVVETKPEPKPELKPEPIAVVEKKPEPKKPAITYPAGEFKINNTRVVFIAKGTSFLSLATQYNVPLKYLFDFNDLAEQEEVPQDQLVYLQRKRTVGANPIHVVAEGETTYSIAQEQGIRLDALLQLNKLNSKQQPAAGEQLYLQTPAPSMPRLASAAAIESVSDVADIVITAADDVILHVVQPKETMYSISKKYDVTLTDLQQWNQLAGTDLKEGMKLIINKKANEFNKGSR
jgi:LysM repeat protein